MRKDDFATMKQYSEELTKLLEKLSDVLKKEN